MKKKKDLAAVVLQSQSQNQTIVPGAVITLCCIYCDSVATRDIPTYSSVLTIVSNEATM